MTDTTPAVTPGAQVAWDSCRDWRPMLAALAAPGAADRLTLVRALLAIARTASPLVPAAGLGGDVNPEPPWPYVALAVAGVCECAAGYSIRHVAVDLVAHAVAVHVERACSGLPDDDDTRATIVDAVEEAMQTVITRMLRAHFPGAPTTWKAPQ
jgi:hypothetical protein